MNRKYLTESARITDAYSQIYAKKEVVNESEGSGSFNAALKSGDLPIDGKGSTKTGSKLGRGEMMTFDKRDAKSDAGHRIPMKKTFGNGKVSGNLKTRATEKSTEIGSSQTGSKLGRRPMMPFEKRDAKPTSIGKIGGVKNVGCVTGLKESEEFEMEVIDTNADDIAQDAEDTVGCCEKCAEVLNLVKDVFEQIYDNLSDDDKALVDEAKAEVESQLSGDEDDEEIEDADSDEEIEDSDGEEEEEDLGESVVTEGAGKAIVGKVTAGAAKTAGKEAVKTGAKEAGKEAAKTATKTATKTSAKKAGKEVAKTAEKTIVNGMRGEVKKLEALAEKIKEAKAAGDKDAVKAMTKEWQTKWKELYRKADTYDKAALRGVRREFEGTAAYYGKKPFRAAGEKAADLVQNSPVKTLAGAAGAGAVGTIAAQKLLSGSTANDNIKPVTKTKEEAEKDLEDSKEYLDWLAAREQQQEQQAKDDEEKAKQEEFNRRMDAYEKMKAEKNSSSDGSKSSSEDNIGTTIGRNIGGLVGGLVGDLGAGVGKGVGYLGKGIGDATSGIAGGASDLLSAPFNAVSTLTKDNK